MEIYFAIAVLAFIVLLAYYHGKDELDPMWILFLVALSCAWPVMIFWAFLVWNEERKIP